MRSKLAIFLALIIGFSPLIATAEIPEYELSIKNHIFSPAELKVPANTRLKLQIWNQDTTPEEFESHDFNREKVIPGGAKGIVLVGPLKPGEYAFFGEFNPKTAQGKLIVEAAK